MSLVDDLQRMIDCAYSLSDPATLFMPLVRLATTVPIFNTSGDHVGNIRQYADGNHFHWDHTQVVLLESDPLPADAVTNYLPVMMRDLGVDLNIRPNNSILYTAINGRDMRFFRSCTVGGSMVTIQIGIVKQPMITEMLRMLWRDAVQRGILKVGS